MKIYYDKEELYPVYTPQDGPTIYVEVLNVPPEHEEQARVLVQKMKADLKAFNKSQKSFHQFIKQITNKDPNE